MYCWIELAPGKVGCAPRAGSGVARTQRATVVAEIERSHARV
jgi:hypothetical protein